MVDNHPKPPADADDASFHRERERQEREMVADATNPAAAKLHEEVAAKHAEKLDPANAKPDPEKEPGETSAALKRDATDPDNRDQTRDAGPENIRDISHPESWDSVDEASDESFPASDPKSPP